MFFYGKKKVSYHDSDFSASDFVHILSTTFYPLSRCQSGCIANVFTMLKNQGQSKKNSFGYQILQIFISRLQCCSIFVKVTSENLLKILLKYERISQISFMLFWHALNVLLLILAMWSYSQWLHCYTIATTTRAITSNIFLYSLQLGIVLEPWRHTEETRRKAHLRHVSESLNIFFLLWSFPAPRHFINSIHSVQPFWLAQHDTSLLFSKAMANQSLWSTLNNEDLVKQT